VIFGYELFIIALMLALNAIFAAYEMGLASISRARLAVLVNENKKGAVDAAFMKDRIEASLAIIQLGITLVGSLAAAVGGVAVGDVFVPYLQNYIAVSKGVAQAIALVTLIVPLTLATMIFAELVPKMIALNNKEWIVLRLSPAMKFLSNITNPVISIIEAIVKKIVRLLSRLSPKNLSEKKHDLYEFKVAVSLARSAQLLGAREEKIVLSAAHLSTLLVRNIAIPAQDVSMIYIENTLTDAFLKAHLDMHTRFPVCSKEGDPQTIEGYVNFKDTMVALKLNPSNPTIRGITRPIKKVNESMPLSNLLEVMIQEKTHIVLVVSKDGVTLGMVTLEDIIEELVGEIEDEFDRLPTHIHSYGSSWIMGGGVPMTTVASTAGFDWQGKFKDSRIPSLAEWCAEQVEHPLVGGEIIESDKLMIVPRKFRRKKLSEAVVSLIDS